MSTLPRFAVSIHPETLATSRSPESIQFVGKSWPYAAEVRRILAEQLASYPNLPLRLASFDAFATVHTETYLEQIEQMANDVRLEAPPRLSAECSGLEYCLPGYQAGLGGMLEAVDQMRAGTLDRAYCFSLGGHHAYPDWGHGYCLLNPQAAAVRYAQAHSFSRVVIIDWDIHHGDGTQTIFANDPTVYCISVHSAADLYMATVAGLMLGTTAAAEAVGQCNIPVLHERYDDNLAQRIGLAGQWYRSHETTAVLATALQNLPWKPDLICIFSGYDGHRDDCGRKITDWTDADYVHLTRLVLDRAAQVQCPVLSVHGGGYQLPVTVSAAMHHIETLASYGSGLR